MTIFYPDVSNYNGGLIIQPGTVAVCAKATEGRTFVDGWYNNFRDQAARVGAIFFAYHWLHHGNIDAQAAHCFSIVGRTPVMIDCEDTSDLPTVADCLAFAAGLRTRGGVCTTVYLPHWYWVDLGSPDLRPLVSAGLALVSSNYTTYSDTGPGWGSYGGVTPDIWQYSSTFSYGGRAVDINAFRGTADQLAALINGGSTMADDYTPLGTPPGILLAAGGPPRTMATLVADLWAQEVAGHDPYRGVDKSQRTQQLQRIEDALTGLTAPTVTQDQVDSAVSKVMTDPDWLAKLAAAVAGHIHVS